MFLGLKIRLIHSIICFLKACIVLNYKVVPNDILKFGGERTNPFNLVALCNEIIISKSLDRDQGVAVVAF